MNFILKGDIMKIKLKDLYLLLKHDAIRYYNNILLDLMYKNKISYKLYEILEYKEKKTDNNKSLEDMFNDGDLVEISYNDIIKF